MSLQKQVNLTLPKDFYPESSVLNNTFIQFFEEKWKELDIENSTGTIKNDFRQVIARLLVEPQRLSLKWAQEKPMVRYFIYGNFKFPLSDEIESKHDVMRILINTMNFSELSAWDIEEDSKGNYIAERKERTMLRSYETERYDRRTRALENGLKQNIFKAPNALELNRDKTIGFCTVHEEGLIQMLGEYRFDLAFKNFKEYFLKTTETTRYWSYTDIVSGGDKWNDFLVEDQLRSDLCLL